ncbi:MAG: hypothetical protein Q9Q40_14940 [Acidobacteriota bacterium]|nr:hypothetical protein [Acidobacteriota bacterium]
MISKFWRWLEQTTLHFESRPWGPWRLVATLVGIVTVRNLLEILLAKNPVFEALAAFVHYPLAYVAPFVALTLLLAGFSGVAPLRVVRLMTLAWLLTLLPPLLDLLLHAGGSQPTIGYLSADPRDLLRIWLLFFHPFTPLTGTTPGIRLEALLAVLLGVTYVFLRSRSRLRALLSMPAIYATSLFFFSLPSLMLAMFRSLGLGTTLDSFYRGEGALLRPNRASSADSIACLWLVPLLLALGWIWVRFERGQEGTPPEPEPAASDPAPPPLPKGWSLLLVGALLSGVAAGVWLYLPFERFSSLAPFDILAIVSAILAVTVLVGAVSRFEGESFDFAWAARGVLALALVAALGRSVAVGLLAMVGALLPVATGVFSSRIRPLAAGLGLALSALAAMCAGFALVIGPDALARLPDPLILPPLAAGFVLGSWSVSARPWVRALFPLLLPLTLASAFFPVLGFPRVALPALLAVIAGVAGIWPPGPERGAAGSSGVLGLTLLVTMLSVVSAGSSQSELRQQVACVPRLEIVHGQQAEERGNWPLARAHYRKALACDASQVGALSRLALGFMRYDKNIDKGIQIVRAHV